ncbi:MAG: D-aminoacyl-tRNA deacylase [Chitinispirillia bacterium]|nr:D-aminoacyl-tRNA deacylase [Chitinispirillia bacterium]MCL2268387.1 D-aminoacyl-tRNA deacylase [Chitinispirillia bacterium]
MIIIAQRVSSSSVAVDGKIVGSIDKGLMLLIGVHKDDTESSADHLAAKCADLRIFPDESGKMNLSLKDIDGEALAISQFTLLGNCSKGRRPNFTDAAPAEKGRLLYEYFVSKLKTHVRKVETGIFGADMKVTLVNDGPVTITING